MQQGPLLAASDSSCSRGMHFAAEVSCSPVIRFRAPGLVPARVRPVTQEYEGGHVRVELEAWPILVSYFDIFARLSAWKAQAMICYMSSPIFWLQAYFLGYLMPLQLQREDEAHVHARHASIAHFPEQAAGVTGGLWSPFP